MQIESKIARKKLFYLWLSVSAVIALIMITQQLNGKFEDKSKEAWIWFSANISPYLALICSGFILDMKNKRVSKVDKSYYNVSFCTSIVYLLLLIGIIISSPFSNLGAIRYLRETNLFLIIIQSVLSAVTGVFYLQGNANK